jgi:hypothetical protein
MNLNKNLNFEAKQEGYQEVGTKGGMEREIEKDTEMAIKRYKGRDRAWDKGKDRQLISRHAVGEW